MSSEHFVFPIRGPGALLEIAIGRMETRVSPWISTTAPLGCSAPAARTQAGPRSVASRPLTSRPNTDRRSAAPPPHLGVSFMTVPPLFAQ